MEHVREDKDTLTPLGTPMEYAKLAVLKREDPDVDMCHVKAIDHFNALDEDFNLHFGGNNVRR